MKRDLQRLTAQQYDILVVGGGIYGARVLWDATLRGLSAALVEKGDFGGATSANSLKIIHGGLRYLQDFSIRRMRTMVRERSNWLRIAPQFVRPLPCLMPTADELSRSRMVMGLGLKLNDLISHDRNDELEAERSIPDGRLLSREECERLLPGMDLTGTRGGALWYDAQINNTERLLLAFIQAATEAGASAANYVEVTGLLQNGSVVEGATAVDVLQGETLTIRARIVVNCAGAATNSLAQCLRDGSAMPHLPSSIAANVVTRRLQAGHAVAVPASITAQNGNRPSSSGHLPKTLFVVPWKENSLIGTLHLPADGSVGQPTVSHEAIQSLLAVVNQAWPGARLSLEDVRHIQAGYLPAYDNGSDQAPVQLVRDSLVVDHEQVDGITGFISVVGVKYSTARHTAEEVVDIASRKLKGTVLPCRTHTVSIARAVGDRLDRQAPRKSRNGLERPTLRHLQENYGERHERVLASLASAPGLEHPISDRSPVLGGEVVYAVREEMALKLSDVIRRRTILGAAGLPDEAAIHRCAAIMGDELGWTAQRKAQEIEAVYQNNALSHPEAV